MAGLYPSLEDMKVDQVMQVQQRVFSEASSTVPNPPVVDSRTSGALPYPLHPDSPGFPVMMYPELSSYMGLEFNEQTLKDNMPEYIPVQAESGSSEVAVPVTQPLQRPTEWSGMVAPISAGSLGLLRSNINHGIRQVVLCKGKDGKVGLKVQSIDKGVFVALVTKDSPAALGGLRFGDQILQIGGENLAGYSEDKVHKIIKKSPVNNIVLAVRDRPFERTLTLHKDSAGCIGFQFQDGEIKAIVVGSSAARNGLLTSHHLVEIDGQNVVGMKDKGIGEIIDKSGNVVTVTVIPSFVFKHMVKNMSSSIMRSKMDHSIPNM